LVVAVACGWVAYALYGEAAQDHAAQVRVTQLQQADAALQAQIAQRSQEITQAQNAAWVEDEARKLGYYFPGEKVYVVAPGGKSEPSSAGVNASKITFQPTPTPTPVPTPTPTPRPSASASASPPAGTPSPTP
jgi:hypothetical protein